MRVSSTLMSWSNENKSCMRVDKREFVFLNDEERFGARYDNLSLIRDKGM